MRMAIEGGLMVSSPSHHGSYAFPRHPFLLPSSDWRSDSFSESPGRSPHALDMCQRLKDRVEELERENSTLQNLLKEKGELLQDQETILNRQAEEYEEKIDEKENELLIARRNMRFLEQAGSLAANASQGEVRLTKRREEAAEARAFAAETELPALREHVLLLERTLKQERMEKQLLERENSRLQSSLTAAQNETQYLQKAVLRAKSCEVERVGSAQVGQQYQHQRQQQASNLVQQPQRQQLQQQLEGGAGQWPCDNERIKASWHSKCRMSSSDGQDVESVDGIPGRSTKEMMAVERRRSGSCGRAAIIDGRRSSDEPPGGRRGAQGGSYGNLPKASRSACSSPTTVVASKSSPGRTERSYEFDSERAAHSEQAMAQQEREREKDGESGSSRRAPRLPRLMVPQVDLKEIVGSSHLVLQAQTRAQEGAGSQRTSGHSHGRCGGEDAKETAKKASDEFQPLVRVEEIREKMKQLQHSSSIKQMQLAASKRGIV